VVFSEKSPENGILPKALVKTLKDERKTLAAEVKGFKNLVRERRRDARRTERTGNLFGSSLEILIEASDTEEEGLAKWQRIQEIDKQLDRHTSLEGELKKLRANMREVEKQKDEMIAAARAKISEDEARRLILERFQRLLTEQFDSYLRQYQRGFIAAVENLWQKYAVTMKKLLAGRDQAATQLDIFMKELGYE
jgi:type I restriction enzyme M protein